LPGRSPRDAYAAFVEPLQQDVRCITDDQLVSSPGGRHEVDKTHSLTLASGPILLTEDGVQLKIGLQYMIIKTGKSGRDAYKVSTRAYTYLFLDIEDRPTMAYHWHPFGLSDFAEPHLHPYSIGGSLPRKAHYPSSRVSLESVIRFCIEQGGAEPKRDNWDAVLALNEGKFLLYRSWADTSKMPQP